VRDNDIALGRRTTGPEREAQHHLTGGGLRARRRRETKDQPDARMFANLCDHNPRQVFEMSLDGIEAIVALEWIAQKLGYESVDEGIALLRRHVVPHRVHAMLAIDDRLTDQAIEISWEEQPVIDVDNNVATVMGMRADVGRGRETADRVPELGRTTTRFVEMIDQKVRQLFRCNESEPITIRRQPFSERVPINLALSPRLDLGFARRQPPQVAPSRHQRGAGRSEPLAECRLR
jgi:uncharacterized protein (DUF2164 family)